MTQTIVEAFKELEKFTPLQCGTGKGVIGLLMDELKKHKLTVEELYIIFDSREMTTNLVEDEAERNIIKSISDELFNTVVNIIKVMIDATKQIVEQLEEKEKENAKETSKSNQTEDKNPTEKESTSKENSKETDTEKED